MFYGNITYICPHSATPLHVLRENNEHIITSNGRRNIKLIKFNYKLSGPREKAYIL